MFFRVHSPWTACSHSVCVSQRLEEDEKKVAFDAVLKSEAAVPFNLTVRQWPPWWMHGWLHWGMKGPVNLILPFRELEMITGRTREYSVQYTLVVHSHLLKCLLKQLSIIYSQHKDRKNTDLWPFCWCRIDWELFPVCILLKLVFLLSQQHLLMVSFSNFTLSENTQVTRSESKCCSFEKSQSQRLKIWFCCWKNCRKKCRKKTYMRIMLIYLIVLCCPKSYSVKEKLSWNMEQL